MHFRRGEEINGPEDACQREIDVFAHVVELVAGDRVLPDSHREQVFAFLIDVGDVGLERRRAAFMCGDELAVDPYFRAAINALECKFTRRVFRRFLSGHRCDRAFEVQPIAADFRIAVKAFHLPMGRAP